MKMKVKMLKTRMLRNGAGATLVAHKGQVLEFPESVAKGLIDEGDAQPA